MMPEGKREIPRTVNMERHKSKRQLQAALDKYVLYAQGLRRLIADRNKKETRGIKVVMGYTDKLERTMLVVENRLQKGQSLLENPQTTPAEINEFLSVIPPETLDSEHPKPI